MSKHPKHQGATTAPVQTPTEPATETQQTAAPQAEVNHSIREFIQSNVRKHSARKTTMKSLRHQDLAKFWNQFTEMYVKGELPEGDIKILADSKYFLYEMPSNPYKLKDPKQDANAFVQADMKELSITGDIIEGVKVKFDAREVSKNRVTYFNAILAQELILAAPNDETKQAYKARFDKLNSLAPRAGYGSQ